MRSGTEDTTSEKLGTALDDLTDGFSEQDLEVRGQ
jgi:hypothetical protein